MVQEKKRVYNSEIRDKQANQTRNRILEAAKKLFQKNGFDQVTIDQLAKTAKVSMPTVYALFKSKRGVLQSLIDEALPPSQFWSLVEETMQEKSPIVRLGIAAKMTRQLYDAEKELMDILRSAAVLTPEFKELEREREQRRYKRQRETIEMMEKEGSLGKGLSVARARDIFWAFTGRDLYRLFVIERKWTSDEYENWLAQLLVETLTT